jgi:hypothetical protein
MDNQLTSLSYQGLIDCFNLFSYYRELEKYCISSFSGEYRNNQEFHPANGSDVPGNLATCVLINPSTKIALSNSLIAPSFQISSKVREKQREMDFSGGAPQSRIASKIQTDLDDCGGIVDTGTIWISRSGNMDEADLIYEQIPCADSNQSSDSEHILLNIIDHGITTTELPSNLLVVMVTERIPCCSCTNTIAQFLKKHPKVNLIVGYTFDTQRGGIERQRDHFYSDLSIPSCVDRVRLNRVFIEDDTLHVF